MTGTKPRYMSSTIQGGIISIIVTTSFMFELDLDQGMLTETIQTLFSAVGGIMIIIGRIMANKKIK